LFRRLLRYVHSSCPPTLTVVPHIYAVRNLTPFMTTRGRRSRVISSRKLSSHASHILSKHPVSYRASSHAASTLSIRASSLAANILSSTEHPSQCIEFAANIPLRAENPVLRQTSCRHRASVAAHSVRGKHPREHRSSSLTADIPPRAAHSVVL